jgi:nucleotide sugar dehydrogenase
MKKNFNIGIIGLGYVGKAALNGFQSENIYTYDISEECTESNLDQLSQKADLIFICVPTPMKKNGACSLAIVEQVLSDLNSFNREKEIVIKSTVAPGSCEYFQNKYTNLSIVFSPEFLTEANFYDDFMQQERIILSGSINLSESLYRKYFPKAEIIKLEYKEAEMVKYFSNSFFALKVSYANEIYSLCEKLNIDYHKVTQSAIKDKRISNSHLSVPGPDGKKGFGGSCLPKDVAALLAIFESNEVESLVLKAAWERNKNLDRNERDWELLKGRAIVE